MSKREGDERVRERVIDSETERVCVCVCVCVCVFRFSWSKEQRLKRREARTGGRETKRTEAMGYELILTACPVQTRVGSSPLRQAEADARAAPS